jgi:hypothetical protein
LCWTSPENVLSANQIPNKAREVPAYALGANPGASHLQTSYLITTRNQEVPAYALGANPGASHLQTSYQITTWNQEVPAYAGMTNRLGGMRRFQPSLESECIAVL